MQKWTKALGRERIACTLTMPTGFDTGDGTLTIAASALTGAGVIIASDHISRGSSKLGAVASDTFKDGALGSANNVTGYGAENYEGLFSVFRYFLPTGLVDTASDVLFTAIGDKDVQFWAIQRLGKKGDAPFATGDEGYIYECITDVPQEPKERDGWIKQDIPLSIVKRRKFKVGS